MSGWPSGVSGEAQVTAGVGSGWPTAGASATDKEAVTVAIALIEVKNRLPT